MAYSNDHPDWVVTTAINAFQNVGTWFVGANLPATFYSARGAATAQNIYLCAGVQAGVESANVYKAALNPDSTLGAWGAVNALPVALQDGECAIYNGYIYYLGGQHAAVDQSACYYAQINPNGTLGAWAATSAFPVTVKQSRAIITNGYMYSIGGQQAGYEGAAIYRAVINPNGTLGAWVAVTPLPYTRRLGQCILANGYIYYISGYGTLQNGGVNYVSTSYYAKVNADGSLGAWTLTTAYPTQAAVGMIMFDNEYIYVIAGQNATGDLSAVYAAGVNSDGSLGPWISTTALPVTDQRAVGIYAYEVLYVMGGNQNGANSAVVYSASV